MDIHTINYFRSLLFSIIMYTLLTISHKNHCVSHNISKLKTITNKKQTRKWAELKINIFNMGPEIMGL